MLIREHFSLHSASESEQPFSLMHSLAFLSFVFFATPCDAQVKMSGSDGSLGSDLVFEGFPDELTGDIKSEDFAKSARDQWNGLSKALDEGSKEDFDKSVAELKKLEDAADSRYKLRMKEWRDYGEQHMDAVDRRENGKITDDDVDVLKRYDELAAKAKQANDDERKTFQLKKLAEHSWKEWTEFWDRKKQWEKEHPGKNMLAKRDKNWMLGGDTSKKDDAKPEKPAPTEVKKSKSVSKKNSGSKEEIAADPAAIEFGAGIAAAIMGTQMGHRRERMRHDKGTRSSSGMRETKMGSQKTKTATSTMKSGSRRGGATMNTTVGTPTISFGRGMGF